MSLATPPPTTMTAEELCALPEDGIHREIIRGELRESPMTSRYRKHSGVEATVAKLSVGEELDGEHYLPRFRVSVAALFGVSQVRIP